MKTATLWLQQCFWIAKKDWMIELRTGEVVITGGFFAILVTVLSSLTYYAGPSTKNQVAAGVLWISTAFAAVLSLSRTWQREREEAVHAELPRLVADKGWVDQADEQPVRDHEGNDEEDALAHSMF